MAHGALGARLSCLLELNVIYTAEVQQRRGELNREVERAAICVDLCECLKCERE